MTTGSLRPDTGRSERGCEMPDAIEETRRAVEMRLIGKRQHFWHGNEPVAQRGTLTKDSADEIMALVDAHALAVLEELVPGVGPGLFGGPGWALLLERRAIIRDRLAGK